MVEQQQQYLNNGAVRLSETLRPLKKCGDKLTDFEFPSKKYLNSLAPRELGKVELEGL